MAKKFDEQRLDRRVVEKYIVRGLLDRAEYEDYLKSLPDESANAEYIKAYQDNEGLTFSSVEEVK